MTTRRVPDGVSASSNFWKTMDFGPADIGYMCSMVEFLCDNDACRFHTHWMPIGNCIGRLKAGMTEDEIGMSMDVTKQRVHQIYDRAMRKLREGLEGKVDPEDLDLVVYAITRRLP